MLDKSHTEKSKSAEGKPSPRHVAFEMPGHAELWPLKCIEATLPYIGGM